MNIQNYFVYLQHHNGINAFIKKHNSMISDTKNCTNKDWKRFGRRLMPIATAIRFAKVGNSVFFRGYFGWQTLTYIAKLDACGFVIGLERLFDGEFKEMPYSNI